MNRSVREKHDTEQTEMNFYPKLIILLIDDDFFTWCISKTKREALESHI